MINHDIVRLDITMHDSSRMAEIESLRDVKVEENRIQLVIDFIFRLVWSLNPSESIKGRHIQVAHLQKLSHVESNIEVSELGV